MNTPTTAVVRGTSIPFLQFYVRRSGAHGHSTTEGGCQMGAAGRFANFYPYLSLRSTRSQYKLPDASGIRYGQRNHPCLPRISNYPT